MGFMGVAMTNPMDRPAVLLAFTGTLLDERGEDRALDAAMRRVQSRYDTKASPRELAGEFRLGLMEIMHGEPSPGIEAVFVPYQEAVRVVIAHVLAQQGVTSSAEDEQWFAGEYRAARRKHALLFGDARRTVVRLSELGHPLALVTDADQQFVADTLEGSRLDPILGLRVTAAEAGQVKPAPGVFALALKRLEVAPSEAVMVGASYERDLVGAREAGIQRVVLVDRHDARTVEVPRVKHLRGALRVIERWDRHASKWD